MTWICPTVKKGFSPSSGLVDSLSNKISREGVLKLPPVLKRVVHLSVRHAATLEPAVKDLRHPLKLPLPTARWDGQTINAAKQTHKSRHNESGFCSSEACEGQVREWGICVSPLPVKIRNFSSSQLLQLSHGAHTHHLNTNEEETLNLICLNI